MRRPDGHPLDPHVTASLEAIDATLGGEAVDPRHAELAELSLLLVDERPRIDPVFAHALDARLQRQFTDARTEQDKGAPGSWPRGRWGWIAGSATAAALVAVVLVLIAGGGGSGKRFFPALRSLSGGSSASQSSAASSAGSSAARPGAAGSSASRSQATSASAASQAAVSPRPAANGRKIVQSAQLALSTAADHVDDVAQEVFDVVAQLNGFVVRSSVTQTGASDGSASFGLSVPSSSLSETMAKLSRLPSARVTSRTDSTEDVNNQYRRDVRRLGDADALHTALLKQLADATTTQQIDSIHAQIHDAERAISSDQSALAALGHRIAYSDVSVTIDASALPAGPAVHHGGGFTLGRAAHDAWRVVTVVAGVVLIGLAALIPLALLAALAWWIARLFSHRRRERALDLA